MMARALIALAVLCALPIPLLWAVPTAPMFGPVPWYAPWLPVAGVASYFVGLGWMVRIYRANPEPDTQSWRYRDL
jgi:hypothetical protein